MAWAIDKFVLHEITTRPSSADRHHTARRALPSRNCVVPSKLSMQRHRVDSCMLCLPAGPVASADEALVIQESTTRQSSADRHHVACMHTARRVLPSRNCAVLFKLSMQRHHVITLLTAVGCACLLASRNRLMSYPANKAGASSSAKTTKPRGRLPALDMYRNK